MRFRFAAAFAATSILIVAANATPLPWRPNPTPDRIDERSEADLSGRSSGDAMQELTADQPTFGYDERAGLSSVKSAPCDGSHHPCPTISSSITREAQLEEWASLNGAIIDKVTISVCAGSGLCLTAAKSISEGEELLRIPAALRITPTSAEESGPVGQRIARAVAQYALQQPSSVNAPLLTLVLFLVHERHYALEHSLWRPYLAALPTQASHVINWSTSAVQFLSGSSTRTYADSLVAARDNVWQQAQPIMQQLAGTSIRVNTAVLDMLMRST